MNFQRYLSAKRTVDDRALNRRVEARLAAEIERRFSTDRDRRGDGTDRDRLRVLEVGAGIGATVERLLASDWLPDRVSISALDVCPENVAYARERLPARAAAQGYAVRRAGDSTRASPERFALSQGSRRVELDVRIADAFDFVADSDAEWDLLVAHAFVDLVDPADALATFRDALAPDGLAYCPITFDGGTIFEPTTDRGFEDHLVDRFHRHVDQSGDSRAGRHLLSLAAGGEGEREDGRGEVLAAGGSDWVVRPRDGGYPADEAYFLHYVVDTIAGAVREDPAVEDRELSEWLSRRRGQIDDAELVYCAHQLDLLIR